MAQFEEIENKRRRKLNEAHCHRRGGVPATDEAKKNGQQNGEDKDG